MKTYTFIRLVRAETIVTGLLSLTIIIWLAYECMMNRVFILDAKNPDFSFFAMNDSLDSGNSTVTLTRTDSTLLLNYKLLPGSPYPFAMLHIEINDKRKNGIDFSGYEEIRIWGRSQGIGLQRLRLHLRSAHPDYFNEADPASLKYNEVHLPALSLDTPVVISWDNFQVPGWWIIKKNVPFKDCKVDVQNVRWIEILTPELTTSGEGFIEFRKIEFRGKWISSDTFFKALLIFWMMVWALFALLRLFHLMKLLKQKEEHEKELIKLNRLLSIKTDELKMKAQRDELTGLLNRHGIRDKLIQALDEQRGKGQNISLIFLDIDHFKKINDTLGHFEGDRILKLIATTLQENIRECDIAARWGGEEFLIVSSGNIESSMKLAEKLRQIINRLPENVTCSFGVSSMSGGDFQELLLRADSALYEAKRKGRNRVASVNTH